MSGSPVCCQRLGRASARVASARIGPPTVCLCREAISEPQPSLLQARFVVAAQIHSFRCDRHPVGGALAFPKPKGETERLAFLKCCQLPRLDLELTMSTCRRLLSLSQEHEVRQFDIVSRASAVRRGGAGGTSQANWVLPKKLLGCGLSPGSAFAPFNWVGAGFASQQ